MKPLIGIPAHPTLFERNHSIIQSCGQNYIDSVEKAGGIVLILPITADEEAIRRQAEMCDAYLIPGGIDVNPLSYGENPHPLLQMTRLEYDEYEISLIREITKTGKPVLGICRGIQIINVAFGGTLWQDVSLRPETTFLHQQKEMDNSSVSHKSHKAICCPFWYFFFVCTRDFNFFESFGKKPCDNSKCFRPGNTGFRVSEACPVAGISPFYNSHGI